MAVSGIHAPHGLASAAAAAAATATGALNTPSREMYYIKGSIEAILDRCKFYYVSDESTPGLDASTRNVIMMKAQTTASRGLRVIAMAYGYGSVEAPLSVPKSAAAAPGGRSTSPSPLDNKKNLVFVGFQAMIDPPRKGVADSIGLLQSGGVQVVMITGDSEQTALSIAQKLGLRVGRGGPSSLAGGANNSYCLTGKAIDLMSKAQLRERVGGVSVFARTTPRHKMAIVEAYQSRGAVVAMTGDGGTLAGS
jgi:P-type Ca2+ transporter type 2C